MVRQVVSSPLFANRGRLSPLLMGRLLVRGGGVQIDDALKRHGWDGKEPVVTSVATIKVGTGVVRGMRFKMRGGLDPIKFPAKDLWVGARPDVNVALQFDNLGSLTWLNTSQDHRNQTAWVDSDQLGMTFTKTDGTTLSTEEELSGAGVGQSAVRFTVLPAAVDQMILYAGIIPFSKTVLEEKARAAGSDLTSPNCPTVALKLLYKQGKYWNGRPVLLCPTEQLADKAGLGHLPLLEAIGSGEASYPDTDELEKQLVSFLRASCPTNNVATARVFDLYDRPETFTSSLKTTGFEWPEYRGPFTSTITPPTGLST